MIKWLNCFLTTFIILIIFGRHIVYSANFSIDQEINYTCNVQLKCKVASNIKLTNNTKDYFVSDYKMILGLKNISNVSSVIKNNAILTEIQEEDDYKTILVRFDKPVLGVGELADFSVNFETEDIVKKVGRIYEINIPKVNKTEEIKNTSVNVFIPSSYGPLMYVSPKPNSVTKNDLVKYSFLNNQIYNDGVSIALGDFQIFNFEIYYELKNDSLVLSKEVFLPFPPDVENQQKVYLTNVNEYPQSLTVDENGNYIAKYTLKPNSVLNIKLYGVIKTFDREINIDSGGNFRDIPEEMIQKYTKPQKYWETEDEKIAEMAVSLKNEGLNVSENAYKAYLNVVNTLKYSKDRQNAAQLERFGARKALENPNNSVCMEFSDLTIAFLRAMKIPAREINGYAYSEDFNKKPLSVFYTDSKDLLHSWVEYYDPSFGWVQIDPTWGQSSGLDYFSNLGTNHIVFVRKEIPTYPLPPGSYKTSQNEQKTVLITFGNDKFIEKDLKPISSLITQENKNTSHKITFAFLLTLVMCTIFLVARDLLRDPRR